MADLNARTPGTSGDEILPYRIHVSSRYLDLTREKLELTRLPHESSGAKSEDWWEPKAQVEPLIDFWLEQYSWRDEEEKLNASIPQFRTSFRLPVAETPLRLHFIHARSPHANAVPLLLIPPFPLTNLSLGNLITPLTDPDDAGAKLPFHLVIPSLPGLGFSDALPTGASPILVTTEMLDMLMKRLGYQHYIASNSGPAAASPAQIDWRLAKHLSQRYSNSCLGVHFIAPPLAPPKLQSSFVEWTKWKIASFFHKPMLGYSKEDISALQRIERLDARENKSPGQIGSLSHDEYEPNTLAYALCDSPTGLLLYVLKMLRIVYPQRDLTPTEIVTLTELIWLPGPEATLRFWAHCLSHPEAANAKKATLKPKVGITVFLGDEIVDGEHAGGQAVLPQPAKLTYACPSWANSHFTVVDSKRIAGKPGFLTRDRPEVIADGVRGLAKAILPVDKRMQAAEQPGVALLEQVVVDGGRTAVADLSGTTVQDTVETSADPEAEIKGKAATLAVPKQTAGGSRQQPLISPKVTQGESPQDGSEERVNEAESPDTVIVRAEDLLAASVTLRNVADTRGCGSLVCAVCCESRAPATLTTPHASTFRGAQSSLHLGIFSPSVAHSLCFGSKRSLAITVPGNDAPRTRLLVTTDIPPTTSMSNRYGGSRRERDGNGYGNMGRPEGDYDPFGDGYTSGDRFGTPPPGQSRRPPPPAIRNMPSRSRVQETNAERQITQVLEHIKTEWPTMCQDDCVPVQLALQLLDNSSVGRAHEYDKFQQTHTYLQDSLKNIVHEHHQGFNSSIGTFHKIQGSIQLSQKRVRTLKESLASSKTSLCATDPELKKLSKTSQGYDELLQTLNELDELRAVPDQLEARISEKRFLTAVEVLQNALRKLRKPELDDIGALNDLRSYLANQETLLMDILVEELHEHLYLKSPYCQERWQHLAKTQGASNEGYGDAKAIAPFHVILDAVDAEKAVVEDPTKNPEGDTFYYVGLLVEALNKLGRLQNAVETLKQRLPVELFGIVNETINEVDQRHPSSLRGGSAKTEGLHIYGTRETQMRADVIYDLLWTLYGKFEAIGEGHRVFHESIKVLIRREGAGNNSALLGSFKELWNLYQNEIRSLLHNYVTTDADVYQFDTPSTGTALSGKKDAMRENLFKFAETDAKSEEMVTEYDALEGIIQAAVPGLTGSSRKGGADRKNRFPAEGANSRRPAGAGYGSTNQVTDSYKSLVEPSVFNMSLLLPPTLVFLQRLRNIVPPGSDLATSTLTAFLDNFLVNVFQPQLEETLQKLSDTVFGEADAFLQDPAWGKVARRPVFRGTTAFYEVVTAFCRMLGTIPPDQALSGLIVTQMMRYYDRCFSWFKSLVLKAQDQPADTSNSSLRASARFSLDPGDVHETMKSLWTADEMDWELAEKEVHQLIEQTNETRLERSDIIQDRDSISSLCLLYTSMKWLAVKIGGLRHITMHETDTSRQNLPRHSGRRWTLMNDPSKATEQDAVSLPLTQETVQAFDSIVSSFEELAGTALLTLHMEIRCRIVHSLRIALTPEIAPYLLDQEVSEPDPQILSLNANLVNFDETIVRYLRDKEIAFIRTGLGLLINCYLVSNAWMASPMNSKGCGRMQLNILVLQQNLKNRGRRHRRRREDKELQTESDGTDPDHFSYDELKTLVELCYSEQMANAERGIASAAKRQMGDKLLGLTHPHAYEREIKPLQRCQSLFTVAPPGFAPCNPRTVPLSRLAPPLKQQAPAQFFATATFRHSAPFAFAFAPATLFQPPRQLYSSRPATGSCPRCIKLPSGLEPPVATIMANSFGSTFRSFWHTMTSYDRHSTFDSPYRTGRHVPLQNGRNDILTGVATAADSRADVTSPYYDETGRASPSHPDPTNLPGGVPYTPTSPVTRPYSPGLRSIAARNASQGDGFEVQSPGDVPMQSFQDGLPPPPPVQHSWRRIDDWAEENYPELFDQMCEGATNNDINDLEHQLDCSLPQDVRDSLECHDGQERGGNPTGIIFSGMLMDCEEIVQEWENWRKVNHEFLLDTSVAKPAAPSKAFGGSSEASSSRQQAAARNPGMWRQDLMARQNCIPPNSVQKAYAHTGWIPLVRDWGGNNLAVDVAPGPGGQWGQIILFGRDYDTKYVVARSWSAFLAVVADDLNSGKWYVDEETNELKLREFKETRVEPPYFSILRWRMDQKYGRRAAQRRSMQPGGKPNSPLGSRSSSPYASAGSSTSENGDTRGRSMQRLSGSSPLTSPMRPGYGKATPLTRVTEESAIPELASANIQPEKLVEVDTPRQSNESKALRINTQTRGDADLLENEIPRMNGKQPLTVDDTMKDIEI
ncbi:hypothetical protein G7046_g7515 [Stylonectria norvegica]|nr:hypothetical protein G7046_g7515 [Stylonectria norvegica]